MKKINVSIGTEEQLCIFARMMNGYYSDYAHRHRARRRLYCMVVCGLVKAGWYLWHNDSEAAGKARLKWQ